MKTYVFPVNIEPDEGGLWFGDIPALPGCALSCYPREHVLESLQEAAQMMLEIKVEFGDPLPEGITKYEAKSADEVLPSRTVVAVTI